MGLTHPTHALCRAHSIVLTLVRFNYIHSNKTKAEEDHGHVYVATCLVLLVVSCGRYHCVGSFIIDHSLYSARLRSTTRAFDRDVHIVITGSAMHDNM